MTTHIPSHTCDNCGDPVLARRPSRHGKHWCSKPSCQAAKQRFYYATRASTRAARAEGETTEQLVKALLTAIVGERFLIDGCPKCGRRDAIEGWVHPTPGWTQVCAGAGHLGNEASMQPYFQIVWAADCPF